MGVVARGQYFNERAVKQILDDARSRASKQSIGMLMFKTIIDHDVATAVEQYRNLKTKQSDKYEFGEDELNVLGYQLLERGRIDDAITVLTLNVEMFPDAANVYDSLGEAYMKNDQITDAIRNYEKSLTLDATNTNALDKLNTLKAAKKQ